MPIKPKTIRDAARTRAELLGIAFEDIYRGGFRGTSIDRILERTRLTKGAFFHYFPSKDALGHAIATELLPQLIRSRWLDPLADSKDPLGDISRNLRRVVLATPEEHLALGCPLNNLVQEMSPIDPLFAGHLRSILELWIGGLEAILRKAKARGLLKKSSDPRRIAEFVVLVHEGAFGLTKSLRDRKAFLGFADALETYLEALRA